MQIVFAKDQAKRLDGKKITASGIAQDVPPPARSLDPVAAASSYRGTASGVDDDAVTMIERRCQPGVAITACDNFGVWPDLETDLLEQAAIFLCGATGKNNSRVIDLLWQF